MPKGGSRKSRTSGAPSLRIVSGGRSEASGPGKAATKATRGRKPSAKDTQGKRVTFDLETWQALDVLARDRMMTFQELADEAFRDLLRKHGRPIDLKDALKRSAKAQSDAPARGRRRGRNGRH
jgi:hypothetical protein